MAETRRLQEELNGVRDLVGRLSEDVGEIAGRAKKAGRKAGAAISDFSEDAIDTGRNAARKAGAAISDFSDEAITQGRKAARRAAHEVKEHPVATLAVGAAVGLIVTALIMRRR